MKIGYRGDNWFKIPAEGIAVYNISPREWARFDFSDVEWREEVTEAEQMRADLDYLLMINGEE